TARMAAREAAAIQRAELGSDLQVETKSSEVDLVTKVDRACEERIRSVILASHPGHVVLGEEAGTGSPATEAAATAAQGAATITSAVSSGVEVAASVASDSCWIVVPLDGTVNCAHGFPVYCVSIALEVDGVVEVGVVYD